MTIMSICPVCSYEDIFRKCHISHRHIFFIKVNAFDTWGQHKCINRTFIQHCGDFSYLQLHQHHPECFNFTENLQWSDPTIYLHWHHVKKTKCLVTLNWLYWSEEFSRQWNEDLKQAPDTGRHSPPRRQRLITWWSAGKHVTSQQLFPNHLNN